jgi:citrate lyase subunit beta/citryl-CoA lyase
MRRIRPVQLCRSWLFLEGANEAVLQRAASSGADVLIHELEDFTPPALRPKARILAPDLYASWRDRGADLFQRQAVDRRGEALRQFGSSHIGSD